MSARNDVPPSTVGVELLDHGVEVEYTDGRTTLYRGVPEPVTDTLTTPPKKETHVLVTDPTETEGVMLYVNDLKTHDDILEATGVGRVVLEDGEAEEIFPGVTVRRPGGMRTEVEADPEIARGRVFVFVEDDWSEQSYEFVVGDRATSDVTDTDDAEHAVDTDDDQRSGDTERTEGAQES
ncbi:DUF5796 family protein [Halobellus rarus]|uniref:DUF5796 family protein n=1 Tax=Halobellus rarus TaxID=1126237 RepID=A0ABD6CRP7_9EURY